MASKEEAIMITDSEDEMVDTHITTDIAATLTPFSRTPLEDIIESYNDSHMKGKQPLVRRVTAKSEIQNMLVISVF
jgi:hypothetical protein